MSERRHHHVNENLIVRDGELFHRKNGIGFYHLGLKSRLMGEIPTEEDGVIWLPAETQQLAAEIAQGQSSLIMGELGAGKSALLYGLRSLYRQSETSYAVIDGHFAKTPAAKVEAAMNWASRNDAVLAWDSLDYLLGRSRQIRKLPVESHRQRSTELINLMVDFVGDGHLIVGTSHSQPWLDAYCDPEIMEGPWQNLLPSIKVHNVRGIFDRPEEIVQFYQHAGFSKEAVEYLAHLPENDTLKDMLEPSDHNFGPTEKLIQEAADSLNSYRIAKLFALDPREDAEALRQKLNQLMTGHTDEIHFLLSYLEFVIDKNAETKTKMRISEPVYF